MHFVTVSPDTFSHSMRDMMKAGDMEYRISTGADAGRIERLLVYDTPVATFYSGTNNKHTACNLRQKPFILECAGVPIVPTMHHVTNDRTSLVAAVKELGGYPVVIKDIGGSHGVGVMKIDSQETLFSVMDVLFAKGGQYIMRAYIAHDAHVRLIVIGDRVVGSVRYKRVGGDFRTNVGEDIVAEPFQPDEKMRKMAVDAVCAYGLEFGGVDVIVDEHGKMFVAEANFPCFFPRTQDALGIDIAGMMVDYLQEKARNM